MNGVVLQKKGRGIITDQEQNLFIYSVQQFEISKTLILWKDKCHRKMKIPKT